MIERIDEAFHIYITLELLPYNITTSDIYILPEGNYLCKQEVFASLHAPGNSYLQLFSKNPDVKFITFSTMSLEKYKEGIFPLELQAFIVSK